MLVMLQKIIAAIQDMLLNFRSRDCIFPM
jgi:hypothetical protein